MGKILLGVGLVDGTDVEEIDGRETPQKSHWGVTKVFSKNWSHRKRKFARTREVETPCPRGFLQLMGTETEAWRRRLGVLINKPIVKPIIKPIVKPIIKPYN